MIGESERLRSPSDMPVVSVERGETNLPLRVRLERPECPRRRARIIGVLSPNLWWDVVSTDDVGI